MIFGPILMFVLYNMVNMVGRYYAVVYGYGKGIEFLNKNSNSNIIQRISTMANVVGLMVIGAMIVTSVKVSTPLEVSVSSDITGEIGGNVILVQEMLDKIMPSFLSLLVAILVCHLLKKTKGRHGAAIIIGMMVITVILKYFGIL